MCDILRTYVPELSNIAVLILMSEHGVSLEAIFRESVLSSRLATPTKQTILKKSTGMRDIVNKCGSSILCGSASLAKKKQGLQLRKIAEDTEDGCNFINTTKVRC